MDSELVSLYLKSVHVGKLFTISRNWLILGVAPIPESAKPQVSKHQDTENKDVGDTL